MDRMGKALNHMEKLNISDSSFQRADSDFFSSGLEEPTSVNEFEVNSSMISIPEFGVVEKRTASTEEERTDSTEKRNSPEAWRQVSGDWDDTVSIASTRSYATCDTAATSESVQSIIQRLNSETDRRRRRLRRRRSIRNEEARNNAHHEREHQAPVSPRGFTVEVMERS